MIRVLVVDDSATIRNVLRTGLDAFADIEVLGTAPDPYRARDLIVELSPDVMTLDIEMPRMNGLAFLRRLMRFHPMPVVIVSSLASDGGCVALEALEAGAVDVVAKPSDNCGVDDMIALLADKVRAAARAEIGKTFRTIHHDPLHVRLSPAVGGQTLQSANGQTQRMVAIGTSTGGTIALELILGAMPADGPPMLIAQHMPALFTRTFAARLNNISAMEVREAEDGDIVRPGRALLAPGDKHLLLRGHASPFRVQVKDGPRVNRHRPSVDVLFASVARTAGKDAVGVILTGMGHDGADGLRQMREAGSMTIAQNEASCLVFGMPKVAIELGAASMVLDLQDIPRHLLLVR